MTLDFDGNPWISDLWHLHDSLTVQQAAALLAGFDPTIVHFDYDHGTPSHFINENNSTSSEGINEVKGLHAVSCGTQQSHLAPAELNG